MCMQAFFFNASLAEKPVGSLVLDWRVESFAFLATSVGRRLVFVVRTKRPIRGLTVQSLSASAETYYFHLTLSSWPVFHSSPPAPCVCLTSSKNGSRLSNPNTFQPVPLLKANFLSPGARKQECGWLESGPPGCCVVSVTGLTELHLGSAQGQTITGLSLGARPGASPLPSALFSMIVHLCCPLLTHLYSVSPLRHSEYFHFLTSAFTFLTGCFFARLLSLMWCWSSLRHHQLLLFRLNQTHKHILNEQCLLLLKFCSFAEKVITYREMCVYCWLIK